MNAGMKRREFITLLGGAATPLAMSKSVLAQQPAGPVIGYLSARSPADTTHLVTAFRSGLAQHGHVEGQNLSIEYRWAFGQYDRLPAMAADLIGRSVSVLVASGGEPAAHAAKAATSKIPIVFVVGGDPVKEGLAQSFNRPGGNATGVTLLSNLLEPKRIGLLHELVPGAATFGVLFNPKFLGSDTPLGDVQAAANAIGLEIHVVRASTDDELEAAFDALAEQHLPAVSIFADPFFDTRREKIVALATRHNVPAMYHFREYVQSGGLISYGIDATSAYRQAGIHTGQILKGANPADLPIMQATKFLLVINLKTAKALGIKISDNLLSLADEVIE
jgi:putative ABC transport system substrate-binding protein